MAQLRQGGVGNVGIKTNKQAIARKFNVTEGEVAYAESGAVLTGYKVIYDKATRKAYALPGSIANGVTFTSLQDGILTTSTATYDLGKLAVNRQEWDKLVEDFDTGFTISVSNQVVVYNEKLYRWTGDLPVTVSAGDTPNSTNWVPVTRVAPQYYTPVPGSFALGAEVNEREAILNDADGLYYVNTAGTYPVTISAGSSVTSDWMCVGLLNGIPIHQSRAWFEPSSTTDNAVPLQRFLTTISRLGLFGEISGSVMTSITVTAYTSLDLSKALWYIPETFVGTSYGLKPLVIIDPDTLTESGVAFVTSAIGQDTHVQLSGAKYANCTVWVEGEGSNNYAYNRNGSSYTPKMDLFVMDGAATGYHPETPAFNVYVDTAKLISRPLRPRLEVRGAKFVLATPLSNSRSLRSCIGVERNNVHINGGYMDSQGNGEIVESFVEPKGVTDICVEYVSMPNNTTASNYVVLPIATNRLTVRNVSAPTGWAIVDGNYMRNTLVERSSGASMGCHAMAWNFTARDCTLSPVTVGSTGMQGGIAVTGGGDLVVQDLTYTYKGGARALDHPVATRGDYGQAWEGDITIERTTVRYGAVPTTSGEGCAVLYMQGALNSSIDLTRRCFLGKRINIRDTRVQVMNAGWTYDQIVLNPAYFQTTFTQEVHYPSEYNVKNWDVEISGVPSTQYTMDPRWPLTVSNTLAVAGTTQMTFEGVRWPSYSVGYIGVAASTTYRVTPVLTIKDSKSAFYANLLALASGARVYFRNTDIGNLVMGNANSAAKYYIDQCRITGTNCGGSPAGTDQAFFTECHVVNTAAVTIGTVAKYCHGNTIVTGGSISGRTVDEWYSYRDSSVFRTA